jgi:hypothetical protein
MPVIPALGAEVGGLLDPPSKKQNRKSVSEKLYG